MGRGAGRGGPPRRGDAVKAFAISFFGVICLVGLWLLATAPKRPSPAATRGSAAQRVLFQGDGEAKSFFNFAPIPALPTLESHHSMAEVAVDELQGDDASSGETDKDSKGKEDDGSQEGGGGGEDGGDGDLKLA
eukprot:Hpha_TRINITY_DN31984_c0_g1::TRINITY_DN31984_c0_g1_i1::g.21925::m.21925